VIIPQGRPMPTCNACCTAKVYDFGELKRFLEKKYKTVMYRDVLQIGKADGDALIFPYGVAVFWGLGYDENNTLLADLKKFEQEPLAEPIIDEFSFSENEAGSRINEDHIYLAGNSENVLQKLAISHGIAQSLKLAQFEMAAQKTIDNTKPIPQSIAATGKTHLSRREISKLRGELFLAKSYINLQFDLLDTPEFFWEYPELEPIYQMTANYLEVKPRLEILDKKLEVIHELFEMLADEQKHKHSSFLEWIIIWLIAIEIIIFIGQDVIKWFTG
jgi:uncharacterized Rmd1/YagE family protein